MYSLPKNIYRERKDFSKIKTTVPIPNLIEIQRKSYERFLQMNLLPSERDDAGLQSVFKSVFPISDFRENSSLEFIEYSIGNWECHAHRRPDGRSRRALRPLRQGEHRARRRV
jgi:DNA-directed RNA polymerase subunit beta